AAAALRELQKHRGWPLNVSFSDARIGSCDVFLLDCERADRLLRLQPNHESRHGIGGRLVAPVRLPCQGPPLEQNNRTAWFVELSAPAAGDTAISAGARGIPR